MADQAIAIYLTRKASFPTAQAKTISATAASGGNVQITANGHGMVTNDYTLIEGTTSHDGIWQITRVDANNFTIVDPYSGSSETGYCYNLSSATYPVIVDLSSRVLSAEWTDVINEEVDQFRIAVAMSSSAESTAYAVGDAIEVWIDDNVSTVTMPTGITDTAHNSSRCFCGYIEALEVSTADNGSAVLMISAKGYAGALLLTEADLYYYTSNLHNMLDDLLAQFNATRGTYKTRLIGQPQFKGSFPASAVTIDEILFRSQPYWDAFAQLAVRLDNNLYVDSLEYCPRLPDSATNRPQVTVAAAPGASTLGYTITAGTNLVSARTCRTLVRSKNTIEAYAVDDAGTPIYYSTAEGTSSDPTLGTDRYGELTGFWTDETTHDRAAIKALADNMLTRLKGYRKEFSFTICPGRVVPGARAAGNLITVTAAYHGLSAASLEVVEAKHTWDERGLRTTLGLSHYNPNFGRLFSPTYDKTRAETAADLYKAGYEIWYLAGVEESDHDLEVWHTDPHDAASASKVFEIATGFTTVREQGDTNNWFSSWAITGPYGFWLHYHYTYDGGSGKGTLTLYSFAGVMVAQSAATAPGGAFTIAEVGGSGISGSVTVAAGATSDVTADDQIIRRGINLRDADNMASMAYHRNYLYVLVGEANIWDHKMFKYARDGTLSATWAIGTVPDSSANDAPIVAFGIWRESLTYFLFQTPMSPLSANSYDYFNLAFWNTPIAGAGGAQIISDDGEVLTVNSKGQIRGHGLTFSPDGWIAIGATYNITTSAPGDETGIWRFSAARGAGNYLATSLNNLGTSPWWDDGSGEMNYNHSSGVAWDYVGGLWRIGASDELVKHDIGSHTDYSYGALPSATGHMRGVTVVPNREELSV